MADKGYVVITARKEVESREAARTVFDVVKAKLVDRPDIEITGHFSNHFDFED